MTRLARAFALTLVLGGCTATTDIVAKRIPVVDPTPEASVPDPDTGVPDATPPQPDTGVPDASMMDASDTGMPVLGDCTSQTCATLGSSSAFCAPVKYPSVVVGDSCEPTTGLQQFKYAVCTCTDLVTSSAFEVDSLDPAAGPASASIAVNRMLRLGPDASIAGSIYVDDGPYSMSSPPMVSGVINLAADTPCECDRSKWLNTLMLIGDRVLDNDNAAAQLTADALDGFAPGRTLALDCGRYYFDEMFGNGPLSIEARGRVALFIGGDIGVNGDLTLTLQNGASAEIYVAGNVRVTGRLELGTSNDGNRVLLAVWGTGTIDLADGTIDGSIYAPQAELVTKGPFEAHGSLFLERANFGGTARIHYQPLAPAQARCQM